MDPAAECHNAWIITIVYSLLNMLCNIWMLLVMQHGSAVIMNIVNSLQLPISNGIFAVQWIMGPRLVARFDDFQLIGLVLTCVGFTLYQFIPLEQVDDEAGITEAEAETMTLRYHPKSGPFTFRGVGAMAPLLRIPDSDSDSTYRRSYMDRLGITWGTYNYTTSCDHHYTNIIEHEVAAEDSRNCKREI